MPKFHLPEIDQAEALIKEGKYLKAESLVQRAQDICKYACGDESVELAQLASMRSYCLFHLGKYPLACEQLKNYLQIVLKRDKSKINFDVMINIYKVFSLMNQLSEGIDVVDNILKHVDQPDIQTLSHTLKGILITLQQYKSGHEDKTQIETQFELAKVAGASLGPQSIEKLFLNLVLASLEHRDKNIQKAQSLYEEVIDNSGDVSNFLDSVQLIVADAHLGLADILYEQTDYKGAENHIRKSVELTDKYFDRDHSRVRRVVESAALIESKLLKWLQAEGILRRLLDYYQNLGPNDFTKPQVQCLEAYCIMMEARGRGNEVLSIRKRISEITNPTERLPFDENCFMYTLIK